MTSDLALVFDLSGLGLVTRSNHIYLHYITAIIKITFFLDVAIFKHFIVFS